MMRKEKMDWNRSVLCLCADVPVCIRHIILGIKVLETIKEGKTVFHRD